MPENAPLAGHPAGDAASFDRQVAPYRRELRAYCYRLMGSLADAEDVVQDTIVRAWHGLEGFEGRSTFRSWLYRIATHTCLSALERRSRRALPSELGTPGDPQMPPVAATDDPLWLEPCPDAWWQDLAPAPDARLNARESVAIAFLAALQTLPPQQRAVLVLREVLGLSAAEVADLLDTSVASVNSALQRARATLDSRPADLGTVPPVDPADERTLALLGRYLQAWESGDAGVLTALLRDDAVLTMPPVPTWFQGREAIVAFLGATMPRMGPFKGMRFGVGGGAGVALYIPDGSGAFRPQSVHALQVDPAGALARIDAFMHPATLGRFGLPETL